MPNPTIQKPWYLTDITESLAYNSTTDEVSIRVSSDDLRVTIPDGEKIQIIDGEPWNLRVAKGQISGTQGLSLSGYGSNIGTTFQPAWEGGQYSFLTSSQHIMVWSDSSSDTDVSVMINGLDANYNLISEVVHLTNGLSGSLTTNEFFRVNSAFITRLPMNVGNIKIGSADKTNILAYIGNISNISSGRSQMTIYTVPRGYTFYLSQSNWYTSQTGSQTGLYRSWTRTPTGVVNIILTFPLQQSYNSVKIVPRPYSEMTDIQWQCCSSTGTSKIGGQIEGYLVSNQ